VAGIRVITAILVEEKPIFESQTARELQIGRWRMRFPEKG